jgi:transketolase
LIFSPVHYAVVLYSLLVEIGRLDERAFDSYNVDGSTVELIGAEHSPGHSVTAGSLAQALSQAAGIAYARKRKNASGRVGVFMSDGEFQEGQTWEAVQMMVNHKINLIAVVDVNGQQCDGKMDQVCDVGDLAKKLRAFGAEVSVVDGHNVSEIEKAVKQRSSLPRFVLCITDPVHGIPLMKSRAPKLHYVRFKDSQEKNQFEEVLRRMNSQLQEVGTRAISRARVNDSRTPKVSSKLQGLQSNSPSRGVFCEVLSEIKTVTRPHRAHLLEWMKARPKAIVVTADLTSSCEADLLRDTLPNQYMSCGMAEQNMMSFCGGLAREGFLPLVHTFGVFITRRPFDQLAMSIAAPNLKVILLGFLPGVISPGGITHQAIDDTSLCRSIPNLRCLEVSDATEVESVLDVAESIDGPVYIRMLRGEVPRIFPKYYPMRFGEARLLSEGTDVAIITSGICTQDGIQARRIVMESSDISIRHLHLSTIIPFPTAAVLDAATSVKYGVVTLENHSIIGGIGSATAEVLAENGVGKKLIRLGLPGCYAHGASFQYLQAEYKMDAHALIEAIGKLCHKNIAAASHPINATKTTVCAERAEDL